MAYYKWNGDCFECPTVPWGLIVMGIISFVSLIALVRSDLAHWEQLAALQLLANYLQNLNIAQLIDVSWPEVFKDIMNVLRYFSFDLEMATPECMDVSVSWYVRYAGNVGTYSGLALILCVWIYYLRRRGEKGRHVRGTERAGSIVRVVWDDVAAGKTLSTKMRRLLIIVFTFGYEAVTKVCLRSFQGVPDPANEIGGEVLLHDPTIDFNSTFHVGIMVFSGFLIVCVSYGLPLWVYWFTRRLRKQNKTRDPEMRIAYGALYD